MTTLTASDIAKYIKRPDETLTAAVDRLRNWTKMGLITPAGESNPGTGRKKQYSSAALLEAVLLQALSDGLGAPVVSLSAVVEQLSAMVVRGHNSLIGSQKVAPMVLVVSRAQGNDAMRVDMVREKNLGEFVS